jgi:C1A family cysteine protease
MKARALNWRPDVPDFRDHVYKPLQIPIEQLPKTKDLRGLCSAVEDQGELGSCTGNAIAGAIELLEIKKRNAPFKDISRLFICYQERVYIHEVRQDSGAYIRDGIKAIHKVGAAAEELWPYDVQRFAHRPPSSAYADAAQRKFNSYERIVTLDDMLRCLAEGLPFVFGFAVYSDFLSDRVAATGRVNMPKPSENMEGGHAVLAVGYSIKAQRFIVRNSWGPDWGMSGYFTIPFAYLEDNNLSDDMWVVRG